MVRNVYLYGDPTLEMESAPVQKNSKYNIESLIADMFDTMNKANGLGLAAVQMGIPLQIFVIDVKNEDLEFRGVFINPKITKYSEETIKYTEGCLSVPSLAAIVERPESIDIEWYNQDWELQKETFNGMKARIVQHEYDHLSGKIYIEYLDQMWKEAIQPSLDLIKTRKINAEYPWK